MTLYQGILKYVEEDIPILYEGQYISSNLSKVKHGFGLLKTSNFKHLGSWINNQTCGNGIEIYANGEIYVGNFLRGEKHGSGIYFYNNGSKYIGKWNEGLMNGYGFLSNKDNNLISGLWENNILTKRLNKDCLSLKMFFKEINYPYSKLEIGQIVVTKSKEIGIITSKTTNGWVNVDFLDEVRCYRFRDINVLEFV